MEVKVPFYNIVNMFLTGLVFLGAVVFLIPETAIEVLDSPFIAKASAGSDLVGVVCVFAIAYEAGLIVNRIGSVLIEWCLRKLKWIPFDDDYAKFNRKQEKHRIMQTLSREYALSRTGIALFLILAILALFSRKPLFAIFAFFIAMIYLVSCRKHAKKIVAIMEAQE